MPYIKFARPLPSQHVGVLDHMAFSATGLKAVKARFDAPDQTVTGLSTISVEQAQLFTSLKLPKPTTKNI